MTGPSSDYLLVDSCQTPYGFALIACSTHGIQQIELFDDSQGLHSRLALFSYSRISKPQDSCVALVKRLKSALRTQQSLENFPLALSGTPFQQKVWGAIRAIPYGEVRSYREVAQMLALPDSVRAVANACARNIIALAIPCHRVIRSDGSMGGYRWGTRIKAHLLELERTLPQKALVSRTDVR